MAGEVFLQAYNNLLASAGNFGLFVTLIVFTILIALYAVFVFYFYRNLARKNIIGLNLSQYNRTDNPAVNKFLAIIFYVLEYLIILPVLVALWFAILAIFLVLLSKIENVGTILMICAAFIAAVRVTSQISEDLSRDLAKIVPFTLLALFIIEPNFFDFSLLVGRINQVPSLLVQVPYFLLFIIAVEIIGRVIAIFDNLFRSNAEAEDLAQKAVDISKPLVVRKRRVKKK